MTSPTAPSEGGAGPRRASRTDYAGAVYGSLLAASVVATAGASGPYPRLNLALLLLVTGLVFWATHVYARLAGERAVGEPLHRHEVRRVALHEWSIVEASALPAATVLVGGLLGVDLAGTAWLALGVAVTQQVVWACVGAAKAGASRRLMVTEGAVNLVLGLVIVATKAALKH